VAFLKSLGRAEDYNFWMFRINCKGLTIREGRELATYLESKRGVSEVLLDHDLTGMQTPSIQMSIPHFDLLVHIADGGIGSIRAGDTQKNIYKAVKVWMEQFSNKSAVAVEVKRYGPDRRFVEKITKTR
jgi:hypothetical protein